MTSEPAIVLNGSYHNSLTILRSLARKGIPVIVGDEARGVKSYFGEAMLSRYARHRFLYPSAEQSPNEFMGKINEISRKYAAKVLFPVGSNTYITVSAYREQLPMDIKMVLADDALIQKAHDKYECLRYAQRLGIPCPKTHLLREINDFEELRGFDFPLVVKPRKGAGNFGVKIIAREEEARALRNGLDKKSLAQRDEATGNSLVYDESDPIIQEFVDGPVVDACTIADRGEIKGMLTQVRVKTLPPRGGYGVMNRTEKIPEVMEMATHLLTDLKWHGVAQVEFKYDTTARQYKLMEINPKFWGTLALSVIAGIDFPYMAYLLATGNPLVEVSGFREHCVFRWVLPNELLHVMQSDIKWRALKRYIADFFVPAHYNIDLKDPAPILSLMLKSVNGMLGTTM
jgi:predicted ATP-grasp superfamily ATP-dependent carboligase